jgi:hypothetical protein
MLQPLFVLIYRGYLRGLQVAGRTPYHEPAAQPSEAAMARWEDREFAEVDAEATRMGEAYRGLGIAIGALGAVIIFLALLPSGWNLDPAAEKLVKGCKVFLMVMLVGLVVRARARKHKAAWMDTRLVAEFKRYEPLANLIRAAPDGTAQSYSALRSAVGELLGGGNCQIRYHRSKQHAYLAIEGVAVWTTYAGFAVAFVGAVVGLFVKASSLVLVTVFIPAAIGTAHAINNFLRLPQLVSQHGEMVQLLERIKADLPDNPQELGAQEQWLRLAQELLELVRRGDTAWTSVASHQDVLPP